MTINIVEDTIDDLKKEPTCLWAAGSAANKQ